MSSFPNRRRFLEVTGAGAAATLAGCAGFNPLVDDNPHADYVLVFAGPPAEEQLRINDAIEAGDMEFPEAQQEFNELADEAVTEFEALAEEDDDLTIVENEQHLFLVDGSPEVLVEQLQDGYVDNLSPGVLYESFLEQMQQQQEQGQIPGEDEIPENGDEDDDEGNGEDGDGNEEDDGDD